MTSTPNIALIYIVFFICSIIFSFLINSLFLKFSKSLGIRDNNDETVIRWSSQSKPALGGISFYICFLLAIANYAIFIADSRLFLNTEFMGVLTATTMGFLMGLADDAYNTKPLLKFSVQFTCGMVLIASGVYINLFDYMPYNYILTLVWVVGLMNSVNMLDNMDAITAIVSMCIILAVILLIVLHRDFSNVHLMILLGVFACLTGFLFFNWHPSRMYMGDTGSQFLGVLLAAIGIIYFWNLRYSEIIIPFKQFLVPVLVFIMPLTDTTTVVINRLMRGRSPFVGGKDHTTHALAYIGLSDSQVAMVFGLISMISLMLVVIIDKFLSWNPLVSVIFCCYTAVVFGTLFFISRRKPRS
jgi:UDP-GlcNAc:undecaprenyl-phosphate/decaprenyl-phosphate GlcNAc-1-phosphate transferase